MKHLPFVCASFQNGHNMGGVKVPRERAPDGRASTHSSVGVWGRRGSALEGRRRGAAWWGPAYPQTGEPSRGASPAHITATPCLRPTECQSTNAKEM
jgi:hypothetical protein